MRSPLQLSEEQLGEQVRDACAKLGWEFKWLRKTIYSSSGILDLFLVPVRHLDSRHILHRELKGYDARGRLGKLTNDQVELIALINAAGGDAALWVPEDWTSGKIVEELSAHS